MEAKQSLFFYFLAILTIFITSFGSGGCDLIAILRRYEEFLEFVGSIRLKKCDRDTRPPECLRCNP
jgi:hypothetical protein